MMGNIPNGDRGPKIGVKLLPLVLRLKPVMRILSLEGGGLNPPEAVAIPVIIFLPKESNLTNLSLSLSEAVEMQMRGT